MWEFIGALAAGILLGGSGWALRDAYNKGKNKVSTTIFINDIRDLNRKHDMLKKELASLTNIVKIVENDHARMWKTLESIDANLDKNSQLIASANATLAGLGNLIEMILKGEIQTQ